MVRSNYDGWEKKLGLEGNEIVQILNVKCDPIIIGSLLDGIKYLPGYHMNKANWISVCLSENVSREEVFNLIDLSYEMSQKNSKKWAATKEIDHL